MEIKQYFFLIRKWAWLVVLGGILGGASAYYLSARQPEVYQTSSRVMVSRPPDETGGNPYYIYNDLQLAKTYSQMIAVKPVLEKTGELLGYSVSARQISVRQVPESLLLDITVTDSEPQRAAAIANSLTGVFIEYNEELQSERFSSSEESLQAQIAQIDTQMTSIQDEMTQLSAQTEESATQDQEVELQQRLDDLKHQLDLTEEEIIQLEAEISAYFPVPAPTSTPVNRWSATATPIPTPTLSPSKQIELKETENRLDQAQTLRDLYKQTYVNLLVLGDSRSEASVSNNTRLDQLQTTLALYQQIYTNLLNNYEAINLARLRSTPNVVQIESAPVPSRPTQPQPTRDMLFGAASGALIMGIIAFMIEYLDDTIKTPDDITRALKIPTIGLIGEMAKPKGRNKNGEGVYVADHPLSPITEAFRTLRTNLEFAGVDKPLKTLLITSTAPSEGKTTLAVNLAMVIAQGNNKKVVLIDTDLRRPSVHRYMGIANRKGLSDVFRSQATLSSLFTSWGNPKVAVLTSGELPPNPTELLGSETMDRILAELKEMVDIVILDAPPSIVADPIILAAKVDGVLLVIEPGGTKIGQAQVMMEQLNRAGAQILGAVLNPISRRKAHYYSKYRYYSSAYYSSSYSQSYSDNGSGNGRKPRILGKAKKQKEENQQSK